MNVNKVADMELAKITSNDGDKVAFIEKDGLFIIVNPTILAFENAQKVFEGEAEKLGLKDVNDVVALVKDIRLERRKARS